MLTIKLTLNEREELLQGISVVREDCPDPELEEDGTFTLVINPPSREEIRTQGKINIDEGLPANAFVERGGDPDAAL